MALQQIFYVLSDTEDICVVLTHLLPHRKEEVGGVVVLEQKVDLVDENIGLSSLRSVLGDTVEDKGTKTITFAELEASGIPSNSHNASRGEPNKNE